MAPVVPRLILDGLVSEPDSRVVRCHSRMRMTIYPHSNDPVFPDRKTAAITNTTSGQSVKASLDDVADFSIRRFAWSKTMGKAAGQWRAVIITDPRIGTFDPMNGDVLPGDWAEIELIRNGVAFPICLGPIDTINRASDSVDGATHVHWMFTGSDHAAAWERPITYSNIFAQTLEEIVNGLMTRRVRGAVGGSPAEMFRLLIEAAFTPGTRGSTWRLPPALAEAKGIANPNANILDILDIQNTRPTQGHYWNEVQLWHKAGQTLHQALQFWCFPLMHLIFYDVNDVNDPGSSPVHATIRERPYINQADGSGSEWFDLPTWTIPSWLSPKDNMARTDRERFNVIQLLTNVGWEGSSAEQTATVPPMYAKDSVERFGLRPFQESTNFLSDASGNISEWGQLREAHQDRLVDWHAPNPYFWSGKRELPVPFPEARIGHRLVIDNGTPGEQLTFFIEGADLDFTASMSPEEAPVARSTLTLTRGYKGTDRDAIDLVQKTATLYGKLGGKPGTGVEA